MGIGAFWAKETYLECSRDKAVFASEDLRTLVPEQCTFGFDIIVYVGTALFVHGRSVQEIVQCLSARNIQISENEITFLGKKFIVYLALAHQESRSLLRDSMTKRGGYILHVDGTCEADSPHLFSGLDGISELVLDNIKIPSEKKELLIPFFKQIKKQYGVPIALVNDMGSGILAALDVVFPGTPIFICHFHFLRDIGKDLFGGEYKIVFNRVKTHGIRTALRNKLKAFEKKIGDDSQIQSDLKASIEKGQIETSCLKQIPAVSACALIHWIFDASRMSAGYGFPFDCPNLDLFHRIKTAHDALTQIRSIRLRNTIRDNSPFYQLWHLLDKVVTDKKLKKAIASLEEKTSVFNKLRQALRITLLDGKDGLNDDGEQIEIKTIERAVTEFRKQTVNDPSLYANDGYIKMIAQIDKYWDKLFADPIIVRTPSGPVVITPQRTNNLMERFFRSLKRNGRKKNGTISLNKMLRTILADTPLVSNLQSEEYRKIILNGCETLEERFSLIDANQVREQLQQAQKNSVRISPEMKTVIRQDNLPKKIAVLFDQTRNVHANCHLWT